MIFHYCAKQHFIYELLGVLFNIVTKLSTLECTAHIKISNPAFAHLLDFHRNPEFLVHVAMHEEFGFRWKSNKCANVGLLIQSIHR